MTKLLVFRLFGAMASWGEIAVGQIRPSEPRPTRSALLGLIAAALGLRRTDLAQHLALGDSVSFACRVDNPGVLLIDYQTANWRKARRNEIFLTRADELNAPRNELSTVQSHRSYRCDALVTVAATSRAEPVYTLERIREALEHPEFPLSLGRKTCVPALPLAPRLVEAPELLAGLSAYDEACPPPNKLERLARSAETVEVAWDLDLSLPVDIAPENTRQVERRDSPTYRLPRRFELRTEAVAPVSWASFERKARDVS